MDDVVWPVTADRPANFHVRTQVTHSQGAATGERNGVPYRQGSEALDEAVVGPFGAIRDVYDITFCSEAFRDIEHVPTDAGERCFHHQ